MSSVCPVCKGEYYRTYNSSVIICNKCVKEYGIKNEDNELCNVGIVDGIYYCESNGNYSNEREFTINGVDCYTIDCGVDVIFVATIKIPSPSGAKPKIYE